MDRALCHANNSYDIDNFRAKGTLVRTNKPSSTAFRGFGAPQSQFIMESAIDLVAKTKGVFPEQVREANLMSSECATPSKSHPRNVALYERQNQVWRPTQGGSTFQCQIQQRENGSCSYPHFIWNCFSCLFSQCFYRVCESIFGWQRVVVTQRYGNGTRCQHQDDADCCASLECRS